MKYCETCGNKLDQRGICPHCSGAAQKPSHKKLFLFLTAAVALIIIIVCAFLIGRETADRKKSETDEEKKPEVHTCVDDDGDLYCDDCGEEIPVEYHECMDADEDHVCDDCGEALPIPPHPCGDADGDDLCDICGEEVVSVEDAVATLAAVGDIMIYDSQIEAAKQEDGTYDFIPSFSAVWAYTEYADLTVGNLELNFLGGPNYTGNTQNPTYFNAPEALAENLDKIGFDVLLTANTYSIVNGLEGLKSTFNYLKQEGIAALGTRRSEDDDGVVFKEVNGIKFAFIGFTKGLNGLTLPTDSAYAVDLLYNDYNRAYEDIAVTAITERIEEAKSHDPDVIIAMTHWGSEFDLEISKTQKEIRDLMFKNGVDVILGSHSHVVGPMEEHRVKTVDGEQKTCFVAYSLGNFIADMDENAPAHPDRSDTQKSVILNLEFTKNAITGDTEISDIGYLPLYILDHEDDDVKTRFEVLPIRKALATSTFKKYEDQMTEAIDVLKENTKSDYDSGE